jgi:GxxExxY protein
MPIHSPPGLRRLDEREFAQIAYEVMQAVFEVHNEMGRLFDESVYQQAVARRVAGAQVEVPVEVSFRSFKKTYYLDLLVRGGALFELKAAGAINDPHRAQLLNYLLLLDLLHGKLVNFRGESVEHEFVNAPIPRAERVGFDVEADRYLTPAGLVPDLLDLVVTMLRDWGTGLDVRLYEEALIHFFGGEDRVVRSVDIFDGDFKVGTQKLALISPDCALRITTLNRDIDQFGEHLKRFLRHTPLKTIQWVNVARKLVTFRTLE